MKYFAAAAAPSASSRSIAAGRSGFTGAEAAGDGDGEAIGLSTTDGAVVGPSSGPVHPDKAATDSISPTTTDLLHAPRIDAPCPQAPPLRIRNDQERR
nr:hypothetical protein GCM10025730_32780 [Promicromonospora thailandica]